MKRRLSLSREALTDLTPADLAGVAGAALPSGVTCPVTACPDFSSYFMSCGCQSGIHC